MKQLFTPIFTSLAVLAAAPALAQDATPAAPAANDTQETRQHAVQNMSLLMTALNSEAVDQEIKNVLMSCVYGNSMRDITLAMDKAIAANPSLDRSDSGVMLSVMASICGYQPDAAQQAGGEAAPSR